MMGRLRLPQGQGWHDSPRHRRPDARCTLPLMTAAAAALAASTTRARRWPRLVAGLMLLAVVAGGATSGAVVARQHARRDRAPAASAGAHSGLDRALARAGADGVTAYRLVAIVSAERSVLAEPG